MEVITIVITPTIYELQTPLQEELAVWFIRPESQTATTSPPLLRRQNRTSRPKKGTFAPTPPNTGGLDVNYNEYNDYRSKK